ncbi:MAG TPA: alpha/beta hydrolase [Geminicoccaceae bacterium]|nr:alpha/beta hydrolase [Geminicoccaceae bacterium]
MTDHAILFARDPEVLRAQYFLRGAVPEHPEFFRRYEERSALVYAQFPHHDGLTYGDGPRQCVDLFPPRRPGAAPLLAFIHGGYWQSLDRALFAFVARPFLEAGAAVALLGYDLAPAVRLAEMTRQIARALAMLAERAPEHGIDGSRLFLAGHSAGGHLTAATLAGLADGAPAVSPLIAAVCVISGVLELEPVRRSYLNELLRLDAAEAAAFSPARHPPAGRAPVMILLGAGETAAFHAQSRAYARTLEAAHVPFLYRIEPGHHHFSIIESFADPTSPAAAWLLRRMGLP